MASVSVNGQQLLVKRDDLLDSHFSGNKARKFAYFLANDFNNISTLVGYGSIQANSLYSLAALAKKKGWQLDYYVSHIPKQVQQSAKVGNFGGALAMGASINEVDLSEGNLDQYMNHLAKSLPSDHLFVPEGGRCEYAKWGISQLATELIDYCHLHLIDDVNIYLPAGTGTTALYLQQSLNQQASERFSVYTCACVGDDDYLKQQFSMLIADSKDWPTILPSPKKSHFGKLKLGYYELWHSLKQQTNIEFDLLYDPLGWQLMLEHLACQPSSKTAIYIHQGGLKGNETMLPRYQRKYPNILEQKTNN